MANLPSLLTSGIAAETGFMGPRQIASTISGSMVEPIRQLAENLKPGAMINNLVRETGLDVLVPTFSLGFGRLFEQRENEAAAQAAAQAKADAQAKDTSEQIKKGNAVAASSGNVLSDIKNVLDDTYELIASKDAETAEQIAERRRLAGQAASDAVPPAPVPDPAKVGPLAGIFDFFGKFAKVIGGAGGLAAAGLGLSKLGSVFKLLGRIALRTGPLALLAISLASLDSSDWENATKEMQMNFAAFEEGNYLGAVTGATGTLVELFATGLSKMLLSEEQQKVVNDNLEKIDLPGTARKISKSFSDAIESVFGEQVAGIASGVAAVAAAGLTFSLSKAIFSAITSPAMWLRIGIPGLLIGGVLLYSDEISASLEEFFKNQDMPDWADPGLLAGLSTAALGAGGAAMGANSLAKLFGKKGGRGAIAVGVATFALMAGNSLIDWMRESGTSSDLSEDIITSTSFIATGASLGSMFGPKGLLLGAAVGAAIGLGYSIYNWINRTKDNQEKIFKERMAETDRILDQAAEEGRALTEEEKNTILTQKIEAERRTQLALDKESIAEANREKEKTEKALALQPLGDTVTASQLDERAKLALEGNVEALSELIEFAKKRQEETAGNFLGIGSVTVDKVLRGLLLDDPTKYMEWKKLLDETDISNIGAIAENNAVEVSSSKSLAEYNESMENMRRDMEARARAREEREQSQSPVIINQSIQNQNGGGSTPAVGPLNHRPLPSKLDGMILDGIVVYG